MVTSEGLQKDDVDEMNYMAPQNKTRVSVCSAETFVHEAALITNFLRKNAYRDRFTITFLTGRVYNLRMKRRQEIQPYLYNWKIYPTHFDHILSMLVS